MSRQRIVMMVPLPPKALRGNSRAHWRSLKRYKDAWADEIYDAYLEAIYGFPRPYEALRGTVSVLWRQCGVQPDEDNCVRGCKVLLDTIARAPANGSVMYKRAHLGLVDNDRTLKLKVKLERVPHRADEGLEVEIVLTGRAK